MLNADAMLLRDQMFVHEILYVILRVGDKKLLESMPRSVNARVQTLS
jgi:hypothetical protein